MSNEKSQALQRFREHLGGFFYDFLRAAGVSMMPSNANVRIHEIGERMAKTIEAAAEAKSIEVIKQLQDAVAGSFDKVEEELNKLVDNHNKMVNEIKDLHRDIRNLEARSQVNDPFDDRSLR